MSNNSIDLPSAEQFISHIERLVKIQALAGIDAAPICSRSIADGIFKGGYTIPEFGQLSITKSIDGLEYAIIDGMVSVDTQDESPGGQYFTISILPDEDSWTLHGLVDGGARNRIEQLTSFVCESPKEVFERLFDLWFYDYPGIIPDSFTLEQVESIYN